MTKEMRVGIFVTLGVALLVFIILILGDFRLAARYSVRMIFSNISGVPLKSNILLNGVRVGNVTEIRLAENRVVVTVKIYTKYKLHEGAYAKVVSVSLIGNKIIEIVDGPLSNPLIKDGDYIEGATPLSVEKIMSDISETVGTLIGKKGEEGPLSLATARFEKILANLESITQKVDGSMGKNGEDLKAIVADTRETIASIKSVSDNLGKVVQENRDNVSDTLKKINDVAVALNNVAANLKAVVDKASTPDHGIAGELISNKELAQDFKETVKKVRSATDQADKILKRASKINTAWYYSADYNTSDNGIRSTAGILITPKEDKYYNLRVENIASDYSGRFDKGDQQYNSITAVLGKKIKKVTLYGGAIRSSAGFGITYSAIKDKLDINGEIFRMSRSQSGATVPWINAGVKYHFTDWLSVKLTKEDVIGAQDRGFAPAVNLDLADEDLAYLFGFGWLYSAGK